MSNELSWSDSIRTIYRKLSRKDKLYLVLLILVLGAVQYRAFFSDPLTPEEQANLPLNKAERLDAYHSTYNTAQTSPLPTAQSQDPDNANIPIEERFPLAQVRAVKPGTWYCQEQTLSLLKEQHCNGEPTKPNQPPEVFMLISEGNYPSGGAFNHHFHNRLLAPFLATPASEVVRYHDNLWYKSKPFSDYTSLYDYTRQKLRTQLKLDQPPIDRFFALSPEAQRNTESLKAIYNAYKDMVQHDPVFEALRNDYLALVLFDQKAALDFPLQEIYLDNKQHLIYPKLYHATVTAVPNEGLPVFARLVLDFYDLMTANNRVTPTLVPKTDLSNHGAHLLNPFYYLTYEDMLNQAKRIHQIFASHDIIPLVETANTKPIIATKSFVETYRDAYPFPRKSNQRSFERAFMINTLLFDMFKLNQSAAAKTVKESHGESTPWADLNHPEFKAIHRHLLRILAPSADKSLFNANLGIYQPPTHAYLNRQLELNDHQRWSNNP